MTQELTRNHLEKGTELPIHVQTLGTFSVSVAGRIVELRRRKDRALAAYLITNRNRTFARDELANLLWSSSPERLARHSLNQAIYSIKRLIPGLIEVKRDEVRCIAKHITVDVDTLTAPDLNDIDGAISNIKGGFLSALSIQDSNEFEDWRSATNMRVFAAIDRELVRSIRRISTLGKQQLLMMPAELSALLPGTLDAIQDIRITDIIESPSSSGEEDRNRTYQSDSLELPFVGRDKELAFLRQELVTAQQGSPRCVLVRGNPGVGKTRLVEEFLDTAINVRTCRSRCYEAERFIGFAAVVDLIQRSVTPADIANVDVVWRNALAQLVPQVDPHAEVPPRVGEAAEQARLFEALLRLFSAMARDRPLIVFVDDAQWADKSTRALLSYLSNRLRETRCLIIMTTRFSRKTISPFHRWRAIDLAEFDTAEIGMLLGKLNRSTSDAQVARITQLTGGHPYLLAEVLQERQNTINAGGMVQGHGVRSFVQHVLRTLPKGAQHVAAALAAIGRPVSMRTLRIVAATPRLAEELDELAFRNLVKISSEGVRLRHDLLREAAYALTPLFSRKDFHRRAARALVKSDHHIGEAARHFLHAGQKRRAYMAAMRASENADRRHAYDESISFLKLAMHANPESSLSVRPLLAQRLYRMNRLNDARGELRRAIEEVTRPEILLEYRVFFAELSQRLASENMAHIREEIRSLRAQHPEVPESILFRILRCELRCSFHLGDPVLMEESVSELKSFAERTTLPERYEAVILAARTYAAFKSAFEAEKWIADSTNDVLALEDAEIRIRSLMQIANVHYEAGKLTSAETILHGVQRQIETVGLINELPAVHAHLHMLMVEQGRFDEASTLYNAVTHQFKSDDSIYANAIIAGNHAAMLYEIGDLVEAENILHDCLHNAAARGSIWITLEVKGLLGLIFLKTGRVAAALKSADSLLDRLGALPFSIGDVSYLHMLLSKAAVIRGAQRVAVARLQSAIDQYAERDVVCRLRMELELARTLKASDKAQARARANSVFNEAALIGARPIADRADALLIRL